MDGFMETLEEIGRNPAVMKWSGAVVLALLGLGFMRVRRHSMRESLAFAGGILGIIIVLSAVKYFLF
ncbi:MAG: hypothetical protein IJJ01_01915 [Firmicutes bacterium]|nr:hypothetical protein [Bacillota bacterium]